MQSSQPQLVLSRSIHARIRDMWATGSISNIEQAITMQPSSANAPMPCATSRHHLGMALVQQLHPL
jgi:hypothetical protein